MHPFDAWPDGFKGRRVDWQTKLHFCYSRVEVFFLVFTFWIWQVQNVTEFSVVKAFCAHMRILKSQTYAHIGMHIGAKIRNACSNQNSLWQKIVKQKPQQSSLETARLQLFTTFFLDIDCSGRHNTTTEVVRPFVMQGDNICSAHMRTMFAARICASYF